MAACGAAAGRASHSLLAMQRISRTCQFRQYKLQTEHHVCVLLLLCRETSRRPASLAYCC